MNESDLHWAVYSLSDPRTGKVRYVGVTSRGTVRRLVEHLSRAKTARKTHRDCWIYSLLTIGVKPSLSVVETGTGPSWRERECFWIAHYRKISKLVNLTDGGDGTHGLYPSPETIAKFRAKMCGRKYPPGRRSAMLGKRHTAEAREKIRVAGTGRTMPDSTKRKLSALKKGKPIPPHVIAASIAARLGKHHTAEHKAKIAAYTKNRVPVQCIETGTIYASITAAARAVSVAEQSIRQATKKGGRCKGLHYRLQ